MTRSFYIVNVGIVAEGGVFVLAASPIDRETAALNVAICLLVALPVLWSFWRAVVRYLTWDLPRWQIDERYYVAGESPSNTDDYPH